LEETRVLVFMGTSPKRLAKLMRQWRTEQSLSVIEAGAELSLSPRTIEGIEQERGFSASRVLEIALLHLIASRKRD
jgi:DNA-binding XRE family transcriptional regulator